MSNSTANIYFDVPEPIQEVDALIGVILVLSVVIGTVGNIISILYFSTRPKRNSNTTFFNYSYLFVAIFDLLACILAILPAAVALSSGRSLNESIDDISFLKNIWVILWSGASLSNPLMIGILSFTRLFLLLVPRYNFRVPVAYVIPPLTFLVNIGLRIILQLLDYVTVFCRRTLIACEYYPAVLNPMQPVSWFQLVGWRFFDIVQLGLPIPLVTITCIATIVFLKKRSKADPSGKKMKEASMTVIIVTIMYLVLNLPLFGFYCWIINIIRVFSNTQFQNMAGFFMVYFSYAKGQFLTNYLISMCYHVPTTLNSALNPIIYFWRMRSFRMFVLSRGRYHSRVSTSGGRPGSTFTRTTGIERGTQRSTKATSMTTTIASPSPGPSQRETTASVLSPYNSQKKEDSPVKIV